MKNPFKRWDVTLTLVFFLATIPAERFEIFSLLEDQTISFRHNVRATQGNPELAQLREEIMIVALDEAFYEEYGSFPFRRTDHGKIAKILAGFGAKVVGLDFLHSLVEGDRLDVVATSSRSASLGEDPSAVVATVSGQPGHGQYASPVRRSGREPRLPSVESERI